MVSHASDTDECAVTRERIVLLAGVYFDDNDDNLVSVHEVQKYWDLLLTKAEKAYTSVNPWVETVDVIMDHCDYDKDGYISLDDFIKSTEHCLNTCDKLELMNSKMFERFIGKIPKDSLIYYKKREKRKNMLLQHYKKQNNISKI